MTSRRTYARFLVVFVLLGGAGTGATIYTLGQQRFANPFSDAYTVRAEFTAANGIIGGLGQPVNVVGVKVGQVTGVRQQDGRALVTFQISRHMLPRVYANATAELRPITPLSDMQINLDPGNQTAPPLAVGTPIPAGQTTPPVQLSDLLSTLDSDTRDFLAGLVTSLGRGTADRGPDIRRVLNTLGPTTRSVRRVTHALAVRRTDLANLVHNLAIVTRAASRDHRLAEVVAAGDQTLSVLAAEETPLRKAIAELPSTLSVIRSTLVHLRPFAYQLAPTLDALAPAVKRLPETLDALGPFAAESTRTLEQEVRPLVSAATPLARDLRPTVHTLYATTPRLSGSFQALEYLVNELAYNANKGVDQGFLFWLSWTAHNLNSVMSTADAHGGIGRAAILVNCEGVGGLPVLKQALGVIKLCPQ